MKILKIKKLNNGKYNIKFDNMDEIVVYDEVILSENLLLNNIVDANKLEKINSENLFYKVYNKVLKYVTRSIRSEKEIDEYIKKNDLIDYSSRIKDKLNSCNLINDENYLKAYVYDRVNLSMDGPYKIIRNLKQQNIDENIVYDEVMKYKEEFDLKLEKLMKKKINLNKNKSKSVLRQKLLYYFIDLGYESDKISYYFDQNYVENSSVIQKEYDKLYKKYYLKMPEDELEYFIKNKLYSKGFNKNDIEKIRK